MYRPDRSARVGPMRLNFIRPTMRPPPPLPHRAYQDPTTDIIYADVTSASGSSEVRSSPEVADSAIPYRPDAQKLNYIEVEAMKLPSANRRFGMKAATAPEAEYASPSAFGKTKVNRARQEADPPVSSGDVQAEPKPPELPLRLYAALGDGTEMRQLDTVVEDLVRRFATSIKGGLLQAFKDKDSFGARASVKELVSGLMSERFGSTIGKLDGAMGNPSDMDGVRRKEQALTGAITNSVIGAIGKLSEDETAALNRRKGHHDHLARELNAREVEVTGDWPSADVARAAFIEALMHTSR